MKVEKYLRFLVIAFLPLLSVSSLPAQTTTGALRGQVTDPSGAAISAASVIMTPAAGSPIVVQSDAQGMYEFKALPAGKYTLTVAAAGFALYENDNVVVSAQALKLNVTMAIEVETQKIQVSDTAPTVDVNPSNNAGAIVISGKELEALPDDPDELQSDLEALAGPAAGPSGGQMYIDGFTAGQLPPKSSIREIRVNQNPFSAEYDQLGYGRIEIFTKPGTDNFHGQFFVIGNDSSFNSTNPFAGPEPPYYSTQYNGNVGGPLGKKASFAFNLDRRNINELAPVNAYVLDSSLEPTQLVESIPNPRQRTNLSPRLDWAVTKNNTLTARYQYYRDTETNNGVGVLSIPSQAYYSKSTEQTVQVGDTQVIGSKVVNETRFQFIRDVNIQTPTDTNPVVNVFGSFTGGGNGSGNYNDLQNRYELQNYTSLIHGNHVLKFGGRFRATRDTNYSQGGFNGTFTFSSLDQPADVPPPPPLPPPAPQPPCVIGGNPPCPISLLYAEEVLSGQVSGTPYATQLTYTIGLPTTEVTYYDFEPYIQDDWRVRPNITLSGGLRFETQNSIHDHGDFAPRLGFAWGVRGRNKPPIVVIRGGYGIFYNRFQSGQILQADRFNGVVQQQFIINNPTCFPGKDVALTNFSNCGPSGASATYQISPTLHAPYTMQGAVSVERQVTKSATLSATYLNSRGFDQFITINANAPYPGTPCASVGTTSTLPTCATVTGGNLYRYVSEGNFKQNQLIVNTNVRVGAKLQLFGFYTLGYANSDTSGVSSFPTNSYDISQDWGRASFDVRHRLFLGGSIALPYLFRLSPFMVVSSGAPFSIMSPLDENGDQLYNDRPGSVSSTTCPAGTAPQGYIYCTQLGTFDASGATGKLLPVNSETGPNHFVLNLRLTKTFGFGHKLKSTSGNQAQGGPPGGGGGRGGGGPRGPLFGGGPSMMSANSDRRYNLILGVGVRNVFNNVNTANPNSVLGSRFFDVPNALQGGPFSPSSSANRRLELQATFSF
ncbi:MAG TPA: carboxypeptidase regulatory-like domain-containing protein [Candidatus Sulfotelmatobacter sp.]|nr:carboxypeptidase regulatory-like domain-containing protein [Candidatus Sulfotelmatobacter sp.]